MLVWLAKFSLDFFEKKLRWLIYLSMKEKENLATENIEQETR